MKICVSGTDCISTQKTVRLSQLNVSMAYCNIRKHRWYYWAVSSLSLLILPSVCLQGKLEAAMA
jgi:hypothetical protein